MKIGKKCIFYFIFIVTISFFQIKTSSATTKFHLFPVNVDQKIICEHIEIKNDRITCTENKLSLGYDINHIQKLEIIDKDKKYTIENFTKENIEFIQNANSNIINGEQKQSTTKSHFKDFTKSFYEKYRNIFGKNNYECSGKIYCSEMTSCEEAKFYLRNCPGTKIDGNNDGVPCEKQWCN